MKNTKGFTLLEVVAALLILSLIALSFLQVLLFLAVAKNKTRSLTTASLWAQDVLEEERNNNTSTIPPPENQPLSLTEERVKLHGLGTEELFFISIIIAWEEEEKERSFILHTLKREGVE